MMANIDDVGSMLTSLGIEKHRIVPTNVSQKIFRQHLKFNQFESKIPYFPLEWFDCDYENNDMQSKLFADIHSKEGVYGWCWMCTIDSKKKNRQNVDVKKSEFHSLKQYKLCCSMCFTVIINPCFIYFRSAFYVSFRCVSK